MPEHLVSEYHKARNLVVTISGIVFLWWLGLIPLEGAVPGLGIKIPHSAKTPYVIAALLSWGVFRLIIEWNQSAKSRRDRIASKLDLTLTLILAVVALCALVPELSLPVRVPALSTFLLDAGFVLAGFVVGGLLRESILYLFLIRSRSRASRIALPRVPVAVRAIWRMTTIVLVVCIFGGFLVSYFSQPLIEPWPWLFGVPAGLFALSGIFSLAALVVCNTAKTGKKPKLLRTRLESLLGAMDVHDALYQIGGFDQPISHNNSRLYEASARGDVSSVQKCLNDEDDPDEINSLGWTALMIATAEGHLEVARELLDAEADINIVNLAQRSALMFAARYGNLEIVRLLLNHDAQLSVGNHLGKSKAIECQALSAAASFGHFKVVKELLEAGADPTSIDLEGKTAQDYARESGYNEIVEFLNLRRHNDWPSEFEGTWRY